MSMNQDGLFCSECEQAYQFPGCSSAGEDEGEGSTCLGPHVQQR